MMSTTKFSFAPLTSISIVGKTLHSQSNKSTVIDLFCYVFFSVDNPFMDIFEYSLFEMTASNYTRKFSSCIRVNKD